MPLGEIGELILTGPQVTREYVTRVEENRYAKIRDAEGHIWHRIGDVGRLDAKDRFWFCGRKAHRVETADGTFFSVPCEAILNQHPDVARTALAGIPAEDGLRKPVIFIEPKKESFPKNKAEKEALIGSVRALAATSPITEKIEHFLICSPFPSTCDITPRSIAKSFRKRQRLFSAANSGARESMRDDVKRSSRESRLVKNFSDGGGFRLPGVIRRWGSSSPRRSSFPGASGGTQDGHLSARRVRPRKGSKGHARRKVPRFPTTVRARPAFPIAALMTAPWESRAEPREIHRKARVPPPRGGSRSFREEALLRKRGSTRQGSSKPLPR
jgi:hypothetical protein